MFFWCFCSVKKRMYSLSQNVDTGTLRETFFNNQLRAGHVLSLPPKGDFFVDGKFLFEVGGSKKSFDRIADVPDSFLAVDDTEFGHGNRIPLWMFGMLY